MCTLLVFVRAFSGAPLLVAANRDEKLDRPAEPPALREVGGRKVLAPRDVEAGGTWLGVNDAGVFVGVTNRFGVPRDPARRSRGHVVLEALGHATARAAAEEARALDPKGQNGFHLVLADRTEAHLVTSTGDAIRHEVLPPGLLVVTERSFGAAPTEREPLVRARLAALGAIAPAAPAGGGAVEPSLASLEALLAVHHADGFEGVCVHVPVLGYGTRSSTVVRFGDAPSELTFRHADGPPCTTPFRPVAGFSAVRP